MKTLFIVNPAAGHGRAASRWKDTAGRLVEELGAAVWPTAGPGDASRLVRRALEQGFRAIIAVGGDGTLSEAMQGFLFAEPQLRREAFLGTWPAGSGCDTARHLGIVRDADLWKKWLAKPNIRRLDAGKVTYMSYDGRSVERHFLNIASLGIAGDIGIRSQRSGKPLGGTLSYLLDSLIVLATARAKPLEISINGVVEPKTHYHLIALANTSSTGGGMLIAPKADASDGHLNFVGVGDLSRWNLLRYFSLIYTGGHIGKPKVSHRLVRRVDIRSEETVHLNIDGEVAGTLPASFEILPGAIPFLCPI